MELVYFIGRFHVLALHLPIGILLLAVALEALARRPRFRHLAPAVTVVWLAGAVTAIGTMVLGYLHALESGFEGDAVQAHRIAGTLLAVLTCLTWMLRARFDRVYARIWPLCSAGIVVLLFATGHYGGNLTHGETYLAQYAPAPLRYLLGAAEPARRAQPADLASADLYLDVIAPALQERCNSCHNENKRKGELSIASYSALMKGGESGAAIVPGDPAASELVRRITLPRRHEAFMPRDGKTPLTAEQTTAISWWVAVGAPRAGAVSSFDVPEDVRLALHDALGLELGQSKDSGGKRAAAPTLEPVDSNVLQALQASGFLVRPIGAGSPWLSVDFTANRPLADADLEQLTTLGRRIHALNLRAAGLTDAQLASIGGFENLVRLRLELNPITDAGVQHLTKLQQLEYLNLYGTRIGDAGIAALAPLQQLRDLFVWRTAVTQAGIAGFRQVRPQARVEGGFDPARFPRGPEVIPVVN